MAYLINGRWEKKYPEEITPAYPTMFNSPDDLTEYSFTPYLRSYNDGWYDLADDTPPQIIKEYQEYFAEQKSFFAKRVKRKAARKHASLINITVESEKPQCPNCGRDIVKAGECFYKCTCCKWAVNVAQSLNYLIESDNCDLLTIRAKESYKLMIDQIEYSRHHRFYT